MDDKKLATIRTGTASFFMPTPYYNGKDIWGSTSVDKLQIDEHSTYEEIVESLRFYFRHEPLAFTVINKMVDLAINDFIVGGEDKLSKTELSIFYSISKDLIKFLRKAAFEYLITGLVVPEITLTRLGKRELRDKGIQRLESLMYPTDMWIRDSASIEIKKPFISSKESYFLIIPNEVITFIVSEGVYDDGSEDKELYRSILRVYPKFVSDIRAGKTKILLDNPLIIKSTTLGDCQYPIPYLYPALETMKHKRNLKKMDYSIAARVISAILHVAVGNDEYPLTQDQEELLDDLETKFRWRENMGTDDVERVFTLFTNHTVNIKWIFPEIDALLNETKYLDANKDIIIALGFPRILITGENERSFSSDPEIATLSPLNTLKALRDNLLPIAEKVFQEVKDRNDSIGNLPRINFKPMNLMSLRLFFEGLNKLYETGNLSRSSYAEAYGYNIYSELRDRKEEKNILEDYGLDEPLPTLPGQQPNKETTPGEKKPEITKKKPGAQPGNENKSVGEG